MTKKTRERREVAHRRKIKRGGAALYPGRSSRGSTHAKLDARRSRFHDLRRSRHGCQCAVGTGRAARPAEWPAAGAARRARKAAPVKAAHLDS